MELNSEQRRQLAAARKLLRSADEDDVRQGLALLDAIEDPALWTIMAEGLSVDSQGRLWPRAGEIDKRVRAAFKENTALYVARRAGLFDGISRLDLCTLLYNRRNPDRGISDLSPLEGLSTLTSLYLGSYNGCDLSPLSGLTALTELKLSSCGGDLDLAPLRSLTQLELLLLPGCNQGRDQRARDLRPLQALPRLAALEIRFPPKLTELQGLGALTQLTDLRLPFGYQAFTDITPLAGLTGLAELDLRCAHGVEDFSPLAGLRQLTSLNLSECDALRELGPLLELTRLTSLDLSSCKALSDLTELMALTQLTSLNLYGYKGSLELEIFQEMPHLTTLNLGATAASDLRPLYGLRQLTRLNLSFCRAVRDAEVRALQEALPDCLVVR